jgi:hypothetical protein
VRTAVIATVSGLLLSAAAPLADLAAFARASRVVGASHTTNLASIWWPLGSRVRTPIGVSVAPTARVLPLGLTRSGALLILLVLAIAVVVLVLASREGRPGARVDALALLALLGLVRCVGDPGDLHYYLLATIVPLTAWEVLRLRRAPVAAMIAVGAATVTFSSSADLSPSLRNLLIISWTLAMGCYLTHCAFSPAASRKRSPPVDAWTQAQGPALR